MKYEESGTDGLDVYYLVPGTPSPPGLVESWACREIFGVVFERKGVISKYCGIRGYDFSVMKVVFFLECGSIIFQRTLRWFFGAAWQSRRFDGCLLPRSGSHCCIWRMGCLWWGYGKFVMKKWGKSQGPFGVRIRP